MASTRDTTERLRLCVHTFTSRLIVGTGRYDSCEIMAESIAASGAQCVTVAIRRERLYDPSGRNLLDYLDLDRRDAVGTAAQHIPAFDRTDARGRTREDQIPGPQME